MQVGELALERDMERVGAGNIARTARARALGADRSLHGLEHDGMLAHGEVVVAAPHRDVAGLAVLVETRAREGADDALQLGEHAVTPFIAQASKMTREKCLVVHSSPLSPASPILVGSPRLSRRILVADWRLTWMGIKHEAVTEDASDSQLTIRGSRRSMRR